jgi:hypothetical protein
MVAQQHQQTEPDDSGENGHRIDRLLDAIELVKADKRTQALPILRSLIHDDSDFEDAWLWMSVAVDSLDQAIICLDNVLRINPANTNAATALYRLQMKEFASQQKRAQLRSYRDVCLMLLWILIFVLMFAILFSSSLTMMEAPV